MLKPHLAGARCKCSADEFLVGVGGRVGGAGGQGLNQDPAEGEEERHEAASSEGAHDPLSGEDPTALLGHEPEREQEIEQTSRFRIKSQLIKCKRRVSL